MKPVSIIIGLLGSMLALASVAAASSHGPTIRGGLTEAESTISDGLIPTSTTILVPTAGYDDMGTIDAMSIVLMTTEITLKNGTILVFIGDVEDIVPCIESLGLGPEVINDPADFKITGIQGSEGGGTQGTDSESSPRASSAALTWETYQYKDLDCSFGEPVERWKVMKGISHIQLIKGNLRMENSCSTVSCSDSAAIYACPNPDTDNKEPVVVSYNLVATMAEAITSRFCTKGWMTSGKATDPQTPVAVYISKAEC